MPQEAQSDDKGFDRLLYAAKDKRPSIEALEFRLDDEFEGFWTWA